MVGLRLLGRPLAYRSSHLSSCQDTYPKARGSANIYFSSQGWSAHVFKKNLRPGNVSTALLHLAFLFSLLIVIFLKALNVVGLVPICRCKVVGVCLLGGLRPSTLSISRLFLVGWTWWGLSFRMRRRFPGSILKACLLLVLHVHRMSCTLLLPFFFWLRVEGLDHWGMKEHTWRRK